MKMNEININIEGFNVNGVCVGCLNYGRKMFYSNNIKECFRVLGNIEVPDGLVIQVCWECVTIINKICNFQNMLQKSFCVLNEYSKKHTFLNSPQDLSQHATTTLCISELKHGEDYYEEYCRDALKIEDDDSDLAVNRTPTDVLSRRPRKLKRLGKIRNSNCRLSEDVIMKIVEDKSEFLNISTGLDNEIAADDEDTQSQVKEEDVTHSEAFDDNSQDAWTPYEELAEVNSMSSDDDVQLSKLKKKKDRRHLRRDRRIRITELDDHRILKLAKNMPKDKVEIIIMDDEKMLELRKRDVENADFVKYKYRCPECINIFNSSKLLEVHISRKHNPTEKKVQFRCDICNALYINKDSMTAHRLNHYNGFRCKICGFESGIRKIMVLHLNRLHDNLEFQCSLCEEKFSSKSKLVYHQGVCYKERPQCDCCGKVFANEMTLRYHKKKSTEKPETKSTDDVQIRCKGCDKVFHSQKSYRAHAVIHDGLQYPCPICGKIFQWKRNLARHIKNHSEKDTGLFYECKPCGKRFSSKDCFNNHMKFSKKHVSEDNYNHECSYCGKKFPTKWCMVDHVDWDHLEKIKYQCQTCLKAFKTAKIMVAHINNIHGGKKEPDGEHLCDICGKSYTTVKRLKGHVWAMHTHRSTNKTYKCKLCPATFTWQTSIYKHMKMMHENGRKKVLACGVLQMSKKVKHDAPSLSSVEMARIYFEPAPSVELISTDSIK